MNRLIKKFLNRLLPAQQRYLQFLFDEDFEHCRRHLALDGEKKELAELPILLHSVEKAFAINRTREDFGKEKISQIIDLLTRHGAKLDSWLKQYAQDVVSGYYHYRLSQGLDVSFIPPAFHSEKHVALAVDYSGQAPFSNFADFARSRHSARLFQDSPLNEELLEQAVSLAQTAPSACNRQSTRVHAVLSRENIASIMSHHGGTAGFSVPGAILILTGDRSCYISAYERHTVYIDGGIFMMNLLYGLHHVGLAAIPVIWGSIPENDAWLRAMCSIPEHEALLGLVFVGNFPEEDIPVAVSRRKPLQQVLKKHL